MRPTIGAAVACILLAAYADAQEGRQTAPRSGASLPIQDAMLGRPLTFSNELETIECHPIVMSGQVLAWIAALHVTDGMFLVQRCVEFEPDGPRSATVRHGGRNARWDDVQLSAADESLITTPLELPDWSESANAAFCGHLVAYWGFRASVVTPTIVDLRTKRVLVSESLGSASRSRKDSQLLPPAVWSATCSDAAFDGSLDGKPAVKLRPRR